MIPEPGPAAHDGAPAELRIGEWTVDCERNELRREGEAVRLEPKAVEVLRQLASRPGRVIGREELLSRVWPGVVVGDDALTQAIIKLRKALGDEAQSPRYIETIPKRGYRLLASVGTAGGRRAAPTARGRKAGLVAAVAAVAIAIAFIAFPELARRSGMPWPLAADSASRTRAGTLPMVAVLPFANLTGDAQRGYLSDGLTEDIIAALGRFSGLRVMSRNAVQRYKGSEATAKSVRQELRAGYIVRGSLREGGGVTRVSIELSDAERETVLWSERYEARGAQLFEVQDRIVRDLVGALAVKLTDLERSRADRRPTESAEAYDLVLRARALIDVDTRAANVQARELLARAAGMAPDYPDVWLAQGEAEWRRAAFGWIEEPEEGVRRARALAQRALALPDARVQARAHSLMATLETHLGRPEEALRHTTRAIAINPSDASALFRQGHALLALGRIDEAIVTIETGMRYDPGASTGPHVQLATAYYLAGRYRDAKAYAEFVQAIRPQDGGIHAIRAAALAQLGELEEARRAAQAVRRWNPAFSAEEAGTRLRDPGQAARLREGLAKAGL